MPSNLESSQAAFDTTPDGEARRWAAEFEAAKKKVKKWHDSADRIVKVFLDERDAQTEGEQRLNLFSANVQTLRSLLYGKVPSVTVDRRFADSGDDVARVGGEMLERMLCTDIERDSDTFSTALAMALDDRLLAGMGNVRVRYVCETEDKVTPAIPGTPDPVTGEVKGAAPEVKESCKKSEDVEVDYVHWQDQLWSPCKVFSECRWWAFKAEMSRDQMTKRFGAVADLVPLNSASNKTTNDSGLDAGHGDPWSRSDVWEIWDKERKLVLWYVEGFDRVLDQKQDPLGLDGFWPFPRPLVANLTTSAFMPRADYTLAQDLYKEIDALTTRINLLQRAIRVAGIYDRSNEGVRKLIADTANNELLPVDNWAAFAEKGGVKGAVDWLPLDVIIAALDRLVAKRQEDISLLYQVTGMSDIMRGQATQQTTATEQAIKAKFASVRVQSFQDEFARFASDVQAIKGQIISKHFEIQTIIERSNVMFTPDRDLAQQGAQLVKERFPSYRIHVSPENVSLTDYAMLKQERVEFIGALQSFLQAAVPMFQLMPASVPFLLEILKWSLAGFKGSSSIEGVVDQAISAVQKKLQMQEQQAAQGGGQPPPNPRMMEIAAKSKGDQQKIALEHVADQKRIAAETQAEQIKQRGSLEVKQAEAQLRREGLSMMPTAGNSPGGGM